VGYGASIQVLEVFLCSSQKKLNSKRVTTSCGALRAPFNVVWIVLKLTSQLTSLICFQGMALFKGKVSTILQLLVDFTGG